VLVDFQSREWEWSWLSLPHGVSEEFKWSRPCYRTDRGIFCYLQTTKKHATLGFPGGAALDDPEGLLEGSGKDMRHVKLRTLADAQRAGIKRLLEGASAGRAVRQPAATSSLPPGTCASS
jgi:hypothetical protein